MRCKETILLAVIAAGFGFVDTGLTHAQDRQRAQEPQVVAAKFVHLGNGVVGALYEPAVPSEKSEIAIFVMHSGGDYTTHSACTEMSRRGYRVLCANNSSSKAGADDGNMDRLLLDAKTGVAFLRKYPGVTKVVLLGHSGGGALMSAYQDIAENGVKACQGPEKLMKCSDTLAGMPAADGVMLIDSNWGLSTMTLLSVDPAVTNADDGQKRNPELDSYSPANGFNQAGSNYSPEFIRKFETAAGKRNDDLIQTALTRLAAINAGQGQYVDDEAFTIPGSNFKSNIFVPQDTHLMSHTRNPWPLIHPDGSVTTEVVHSVRVPEGTAPTSPSFARGAMKTTVKNFLSTYAIRTTKDFGYDESTMRGVVWDSSYSDPPSTAKGITVPMLVMGMTGHYEYLAAETIYENAKAKDKSIAFVDGGTHVYTTCKACEKTPGQYGDTLQTTYNYVDQWLSKSGRFLESK